MLATTLPAAQAQRSDGAPSSSRAIDLTAQPLEHAVPALAQQLGQPIAADAALLQGKSAPAVRGSFTAQQALQRLLVGSGLEGVLRGGVLVVQRAEPVAAPDAATALPEVRVQAATERETATGPVVGYRAERSATATRTDTPILETPQAVSVVPRELIEDRNLRSLGDALDLVAGISRRENYYFSDDPYLRGFYLDPSSGFVRDGFRYYNGVAIDTDLLERVEVIKGPASVLYGGLEPGGLVSLISKRPLAEPLLYAKQEFGRWHDYKTVLDGSLPFAGGGGIRIPLSYRNYDSFRDEVDGYDFQIAPVVQWKLSPRTELTAQGFYTKQGRTNDNLKIPIFEGELVDVPISRFLGEPGAEDRARFGSATVSLEHAFDDALSYRGSVTRYDSRETTDRVITFFGFEDEGRTATRFGGFGTLGFKAWATQHELLGTWSLAGMTHRWLLGVEYLRQKEERPALFGEFPSIDVFDPVYDDTFTPFTDRPAEGSSRNRLTGVYVQDQVTLLQNRPGIHKLDLLLGLRHDRSQQSFAFENAFDLGAGVSRGSARRSATSPRVGVLWMPTPIWSIYASYSKSFNPQLIATQDNELADPQEAKQFEVGTKFELRRGLTATTSVFDLRKTNVPTASPLGPTFPSQLSGEETSRGVELELQGRIAGGWQVALAYTYLDAFVSKSNNGDEGNRAGGSARNTFNGWISYTAPAGWGGGLGASRVGRVYAVNDEGLSVPGHTLADAGIWYRPNGSLGKGISLSASVKNLFDKRYFLTANGFQTSLSPGTPRSLVVSLGYGF